MGWPRPISLSLFSPTLPKGPSDPLTKGFCMCHTHGSSREVIEPLPLLLHVCGTSSPWILDPPPPFLPSNLGLKPTSTPWPSLPLDLLAYLLFMSVWYALEMNVPPLYYYDLYVLLCCCILFTFYLYLLLLLLLFFNYHYYFYYFHLIVQHFGQCMLCVNVLYK